MDLSKLSPVQVIQFIADNNLHGFATNMSVAGLPVQGDQSEMVETVIQAYRSGQDVSWLGNVPYNSTANDDTGGLETANKGSFFTGVNFNTVLGALAPAVLTAFGLGGAPQQPVQDNSAILGMQKTTFYAMVGIALLIIGLVVFVILKKK